MPYKTPPLPPEANANIISPSPDLPKEIAAFSGKWVGRTAISGAYTGGGGGKNTEEVILVVEEIDYTKARIIYAWGNSANPTLIPGEHVPFSYVRIYGCKVISTSKPELVVPMMGWGDYPVILKMKDSNTLVGYREMRNPTWAEFPTFTKSYRLKRAD
jgi:hypothetical protein